MSASDAIDALIEAKWRDRRMSSGSGLCDDATFVRRIYLDLAGRIPTRGRSRGVCQVGGQAKASRAGRPTFGRQGVSSPNGRIARRGVVGTKRKSRGGGAQIAWLVCILGTCDGDESALESDRRRFDCRSSELRRDNRGRLVPLRKEE